MEGDWTPKELALFRCALPSGSMLFPALLACTPDQAPPRRPDILLVVMDTVRADRLGAYGHGRATSPTFDLLAEQGLLFEQVHSSGSWTWPAHASLFTGEPSWEHGAHFASGESPSTFEVERFRVQAMRDDLPTLAGRLGEAGYRTTSVAANPLLSEELGLVRGFELALQPGGDGAVLERVQDRLGQQDERPDFLFVNLMSAHSPWPVTPAPWNEGAAVELGQAPWAQPYLEGQTLDLYRSADEASPAGVQAYMQGQLDIPPEGLELIGRLYDGNVLLADVALGKLVRSWTEAHPEGVVIVTSDHGEHLGEHGLIDHGNTLRPELTHVPLVVVAPGRVESGRVSEPVELRRVHDVVLALAELRSVEATILGGELPEQVQAALYPVDSNPPPWGQGCYLHREGDRAELVGMAEGGRVYDLVADPQLLQGRALEASRRAELLAGFPETQVFGTPPALGDLPVEQLRALGYVE